MTADRQKLIETIDRLHAELAEIDSLDEDVRRELEEAAREIQHKLDHQSPSETADPEPSSVVQRLSQAAQEFEDSHPTLSGIVGSIIDTLSRAGI